jgi:hypothetical protein
LEATVVLAILAVVMGAGASVMHQPSPAMLLERQVAALTTEAAKVRADAVLSGAEKTLRVSDGTCEAEELELAFFADGTARAAEICLTNGEVNRLLRLDPLTGRLRP